MTEIKDLSPHQRSVVESWGQGLAVLAGAGSGKTTTLVIKCEELLRINPQARFAAVSFTERSTSDLKLKLAQRLAHLGQAEGGLSRHSVMTIHGLCSMIIREFPREAGFDGDETMLSEAESYLLWKRSLDSLLFDELPETVQTPLSLLLGREGRDGTFALFRRVRELHSFGVLERLSSPDPFSRALAEVGAFVIEFYDRLKRRRGVLDFDDLERGADQALKVRRVRDAYASRFDLILVDEFQDTNPLQAGIISRISRPDFSNLVVIGDPKQSIYRFRDADVSVFQEFCKKLPVQISMSTNYRSRPEILSFINSLCGESFKQADVPYEPLLPGLSDASAEPAVVRLDVKTPEELAQWIASENRRGVPLSDMALLLRKIRGGNEKWLKALGAAGIRLAVGSGGRFWEDPRARELVAFLKWWDNPGNQLSGAIFLRAPWVGVADEVLDRWVSQDRSWVQPFFSSGHLLANALRPFRERICRPGELLLALLANAEIEDEIGGVCLGLWHRAEELSLQGLDSHAVIMELALSVEQNRREREVPPPRNQGQLPVLTLHGSKGLEFPQVILVDLGKKPKAPDMPLLFWDRDRGVYLGARDADGERDKKKGSIESGWRTDERKKELAESNRLFYVALTRARERLVLVCPELPLVRGEEKVFDPSDLDARKAGFGSDDWRAWVEYADVRPKSVTLSGARPSGEDLRTLEPRAVTARELPIARWIRSRHSVTEWNLFSRCPRAYEWTFIHRKLVSARADAEGALFSPRSPGAISAMELGSRVHECLERLDAEGLQKLELAVGGERFRAAPLMEWAQASPWMLPSDPEMGRECFSELSFELPINDTHAGGGTLVGSIDRLILERNGDCLSGTVIDFKVTEKLKPEESLLESYQTQMQLYAHAVLSLEPEIKELKALLVNISPAGVRELLVPLRVLALPEISTPVSKIIQGEAGVPRPGELCRVCEFRAECPEGLAH